MYRTNFMSFFGTIIIAMLFSATAFAASLSDIRVSSALNQNLLAEVTVLGVGERDQLAVSLAPDSIWLKTGISPLPELAGLRFSVKEGSGGQVIRIIGKRPLREPVVEFILQVKTSQGTLQRWYTLLLDPPEEVQAAATVARVAPPVVEIVEPPQPVAVEEPVSPPTISPAPEPKVVVVVPEPQPQSKPLNTSKAKPTPKVRPVRKPPVEVVAPVVVETPTASERATGFNRLPEQQRLESEEVAKVAPPSATQAKEPLGKPEPTQPKPVQKPKPVKVELSQRKDSGSQSGVTKNSYGPVKQDETLYSIANELRPKGVTLSQTMAALLRTNPKAFKGKSENLSVGSVLYVPPKSVMTVLSDREAKAFLRSGGTTKSATGGSIAAAPPRKPARKPERRRTVAKPQTAPVAVETQRTFDPVVESVDESLPIAQTFPLGTSYVPPVAVRDNNQGVPSKARAPRNENPGVSSFISSTDLEDIPLAKTYSLDYVAPAPDSTESSEVSLESDTAVPDEVRAPVESSGTERLQPEQVSVGAESASEPEPEPKSEPKSEQVEAPTSPTAEVSSGDIEEQRAAIRQRAEDARKLAESARAEIERVKRRQEELVVERANQLKAASQQLEKAQADKLALESLVGDQEVEQADEGNYVTESKVADSTSPVEVGVDTLTTELTSLPPTDPGQEAVNDQEKAEAGSEVSESAQESDAAISQDAAQPAETEGVEAGADAGEEPEPEPESEAPESEAISPEADAGEATPLAGAPTAPDRDDSTTPDTGSASQVAGNIETPTDTASDSKTDFVAKAKSAGQQAVAAVSNTASAAASAMGEEPAELSPTEFSNYSDPGFWANYFDRLKSGNIQAHNPILWVVLLVLLLLWLLSRVTSRKEKFAEPNDYGDLDSGSADKDADVADRGAAVLAAGAAAVAVSKDPIGDANFHIDYGMHSQALDIVRTAKPSAEGKLEQELLLKEAEILTAQGDADGLHMLSKQQGDNAELQAHIAALKKSAEQQAAAAEPESDTSGSAEATDKPEAAPAKEAEVPEPEAEPLVADLDSLIADDDLLMDAAKSDAVDGPSDPAEPAESNNLVDFNLDDLAISEAAPEAASDTASKIDSSDDNSLEFDLDSLSAELDSLSESRADASASEVSDSELAGLDSGEGLESDNSGALDELEELTAALGGDSDLDDLNASFEDSDNDGLEELALSLAGDDQPVDDSVAVSNDSDADDKLLVAGISEPAKPAPAAAADPAAEISFGDVLSTQLDLARAYSDMGDTTEARKLLETVVERGSERQIAEATQLLKELS